MAITSLVTAAPARAQTEAPALASAPPHDDPASPTPRASVLRTLTLAGLEHDALAAQPQVLSARAQTRAADATVEQTRSPFLPQVTGIGQYSYGNSTRSFSSSGSSATSAGAATMGMAGASTQTPTSSTGSVSSTPTGFWTFSLSGTQLIYDFGQSWGRYRAARETVEADEATEKATRFQVLVAVRTAYFTARANKELVRVAQETLIDQERHLAQVDGFVRVGTQPPIALAQQKAAVASAQVQLISAENGYETAKAQLNQAAGIRGGTNYDVDDEVLEPVVDEDEPLEALLKKAFAARPEIVSLMKQKTAQQSTVRAIQGGFGPTLSATGSVGEVGLDLGNLQTAWSVGGLLSWPIFQGGLTVGQIHQAQAILAGLDAQEQLTVLQVQVQVDSARLAVRSALATMGAVDQAFVSARDQLQLAEQRYATGVGNIIELNDAQVTFTSAAAQRVQARYGLASARAQLLAALGRS